MTANLNHQLEQRHEPGPGFRYSQSDFSAHEKAVREAGYPWVRSNPLRPTWMGVGHDPRPNVVPDQLNKHGHHGINTHLIVTGDLTIRKIKQFHGQTRLPVLTISTEPGAAREAAAAGGEIYWGTTEQGCVFVEGHRCLSPSTANRFMDRGTLKWVDSQGLEVNQEEQEYIKGQLRGAGFHWDSSQRRASIRFPEYSVMTKNLTRWFIREWEADQSENGPLLPVCYPLEDQDVGLGDREWSADYVDEGLRIQLLRLLRNFGVLHDEEGPPETSLG